MAGAKRVDLEGKPAGEVTKQQQEHAEHVIMLRKASAVGRNDPLWHMPVREREPILENRKAHDPDGAWAANPHPANAEKPKLSLGGQR